MKKIIKAFAAALMLSVIAGCSKEAPADTPSNLNKDLTFALSVVEIDGSDVSISIRHNGTTDDSWYGFATEDLTSSTDMLIQQKVDELLAQGRIAVKKNTRITVEVKGLNSYTKYRYIAFGVTSDGTIYGNSSYVEFETEKSEGVFEETDDWALTYEGRIEQDGEELEAFSIKPKDGKRYYFTTLATIYLTEEYGYTLNDILAGEAKYIESFFESGYSVDEITFTSAEVLAEQRLESGEYLALAIGFNDKGKATGYYSSTKFTIKEETATEGYKAWLGTWKLTTAENVVYNITIEHGDNNFYYMIRNWEVGGNFKMDPFGSEYNFSVFRFPAYYKKSSDSFIIKSVNIKDVYYDNNYGYFGMFGSAVYQGNFQYVCVTDDNIAEGTPTGGNSGKITGMKSMLELDTPLTYEGMGYTGYYYINNGENYNGFSWNNHAKFPITMEKTGDAVQNSIASPVYKSAEPTHKSFRKIKISSESTL